MSLVELYEFTQGKAGRFNKQMAEFIFNKFAKELETDDVYSSLMLLETEKIKEIAKKIKKF